MCRRAWVSRHIEVFVRSFGRFALSGARQPSLDLALDASADTATRRGRTIVATWSDWLHPR